MFKKNLFMVSLFLLMSPLITFAKSDRCSSNEKNRPFKFEWIPEKPDSYSAGLLKIFEASSGTLRQEIKEKGSDGKWIPDFTEWNFDGCPDPTWTEFSAKTNILVVLLYDRGEQRFEKAELLSQTGELRVENQKNRCLSAQTAEGADRGEVDNYCWRGTKLVQVESTYWYWNEKKQCHFSIQYERATLDSINYPLIFSPDSKMCNHSREA